MDHHLKFRFDAMQQASSPLGAKTPSRLPVSSVPRLFRSKCKPVPLGEQPDPSEAKAAEPTAPDRIQRAERTAKDQPQAQKQVKQLQFWLKVFSRFCQDPAPEE